MQASLNQVAHAHVAKPFTTGRWGRRASCPARPAAAAEGQDAAPMEAQLARRQLLMGAPAAALLALSARPAGAAEEAAALLAPTAAAPSSGGMSAYTDADDLFTISVPEGWAQGSGDFKPPPPNKMARFSNAAGLRRVVGWYNVDHPEVSVAVTITYVGADYTGMGSFGTAQIAKLLEAKESGKQYYISYTVAKQGEPERTVYSVVALGNNGRQSRLYTVTASTTAAELPAFGKVLKETVASFKAPKAA